MRNRNWFSLMAAVVFFVTCQASAKVFDHFDNGQLDPAWEVTFQNATNWSYTESETKLVVSNIGMVTGPPNGVILKQDFLAPGDFNVTSVISWDSLSSGSTIQTIDVRVYSGDALAVQGGYTDAWLGTSGEKYARIEGLLHTYDSGPETLPYSGTAEITLKRVDGLVSVLWNDQVMLTDFSDLAIDKVGLFFGGEYSYNYGKLSVDYVNAVPEPATLLLLGLGAVMVRRKH